MNPLKTLLSIAALWLWLGAIAHAGTVTYVYSDPQGTPLAEADANGTITATFDYRPYGVQALGTAPNGPGYTGHVNDPDTGLVYMQARYYDPAVGRFVSVDPVGPSAGDVFKLNRFAYANSNPIMVTDPTGRQICNSAGTSPGCYDPYRSVGHGPSDCCDIAANSDDGQESAKQSAAPTRSAGQCDETCDDIRQTNATILENQGRALKQAGLFTAKFAALNLLGDGVGRIVGRLGRFSRLLRFASTVRLIGEENQLVSRVAGRTLWFLLLQGAFQWGLFK
ncbi:RHS repeat-associated core domain-containing protein [Rhodanobacter sp. OR87]|uniref:RHS repeat-associated core domain-containing protein n=1 Tax=Rhodanobacter sp. OR87 TaxID=1076523 RepID=UPI0009DFF983|nr:RHS repeat-associated core domain-containing protein [Rhodanobacter sp. OR87]